MPAMPKAWRICPSFKRSSLAAVAIAPKGAPMP
jgi:hypothetical protein